MSSVTEQTQAIHGSKINLNPDKTKLFIYICVKMDVGMYVTSKLRNHSTDHHETWHMKVFFSWEGFTLSILLSLTSRWSCNTSTSIRLSPSPRNLVHIGIFSWRNFLCYLFYFHSPLGDGEKKQLPHRKADRHKIWHKWYT